MNSVDIKKYIKSLVLFILLIGITFYLLLKGQDFNKLYNTLLSVDIKYVFIGFICMCLYSFGEAYNIRNALKILNTKVSIFKCIKYALVGFFYSSITPSASGGQPMQVYYMYKDKINVSTSTLSLLLEFSSFQLVTIIYSIIGFIYNYEFISKSKLGWLFLIGILINLIIFLVILFAIFSKKISKKIVNIIKFIINKFKFKNKESIISKLSNGLNEYQKSSILIKNHKKDVLKIIIVAMIRICLFYTIPFWVYKSFGLSGYKIISITLMQAVLFTSVSCLPLPGAVGITESSFEVLFKTFIPIALMSGVMIINRLINFYLYVFISGLIISILSLKIKKGTKNE